MWRIMFVAMTTLLVSASDETTASVSSPWVEVTRCDAVHIGGVTYPRIAFTFHNANPIPGPDYPFCTAQLIPRIAGVPADTCRAIATGAPTQVGWASEVSGDRAIYSLVNLDLGGTCLLPGQGQGGFEIVLSKAHNCCYDLYISGNLFEPFAHDVVCFDCDLATPAQSATWGQVKSIYRN